MAPLICRLIGAFGQGVPGAYVTLDRLEQDQSDSTRIVTVTETSGFTHFWTSKSEASRSGWARILEDNDDLKGFLNIYTHWGIIPVEVNLAGKKSHYILVQLFGAATYQVQHFEFLTPTTIPQRFGQWSAREDEVLIKLKRAGLTIQEIRDSKQLDARSSSAITSRIKAVNTRIRRNLLLFAWSQHPQELYSFAPIDSAQASENADSWIAKSPAPVYSFVLDSHCQMPEQLEDQRTQPNPQIGPAGSHATALEWVDETHTVLKT